MTDSSTIYSRKKGQFTLSTDKSRLDTAMIHDFLYHSYWVPNIPLPILQKSIEHSLCFGVYDEHAEHGPRQVGFARVVSDLARFALLSDVFIIEAYRGQGLGKWLVECIMDHPDLQGLRRFMLATSDAHGLYRQFGFQTVESIDGESQRLMTTIAAKPYTQEA